MSERLIVALDAATDVTEAGGKAVALQRLRAAGVPAPDGLVVTTAAYRAFLAHRGLRERIALELARRPLGELRLEETWDVALRIHALFLSAQWPEVLRASVSAALEPRAVAGPLVVRSSAPHEDASAASYAGLHESVVGAEGLDAALEAVRVVWASLFTDRALLYHAELGLDAAHSAMAVLVQPLVDAERAGVAFTTSPDDAARGIIESVWGLGEGLVSGRVEPDTWVIARENGHVLSHRAPQRSVHLIRSAGRVVERALAPERAATPPLGATELGEVWLAALGAEQLFATPIDAEWAIGPDDALVLTQARPITTAPADERSAYLASQATAEQLEALRRDIETRILPAMRSDAEEFAAVDLAALEDSALAAEVARRVESVTHWRAEYRSALIPMAHGARLIGRLYADALRPDDPFEYLSLLVRSPGEYATHRALLADLGSEATLPDPPEGLRAQAEERFLAAFPAGDERAHAQRMLALGRASWRLRDDDNLYLALVEREAVRAEKELRMRRGTHGSGSGGLADALAAVEALRSGSLDSNRPEAPRGGAVRARQLLGQPAGPGVGRGFARVIRTAADLRAVTPGDVVVADALEPETAAYAARAAGIVERRGGMLVHGAIVAREHGVPCVTGVSGATALIRDGEPVTVDGYLGIVVLEDV